MDLNIEESLINKINQERRELNIKSLLVNNLFKKNLLDLFNYFKNNDKKINKDQFWENFNLNYSNFNNFEIIESIKENNKENIFIDFIINSNKKIILNNDYNQICIQIIRENNQIIILILLIKNLILIEEIMIDQEIWIKGKIFSQNYKLMNLKINDNYDLKITENNEIGGNFLFYENKFKNILLTSRSFRLNFFIEFNKKILNYVIFINNSNYSDIKYNHLDYNCYFINGNTINNNRLKVEENHNILKFKTESNSNNNLFSNFHIKNDNEISSTNLDFNKNSNKLGINKNFDISSIKFDSFDNDDFSNNNNHQKKNNQYTLKIGDDLIKNLDTSHASITENRKYLKDRYENFNKSPKESNSKKISSIKTNLKLYINNDNLLNYTKNLFKKSLNNIKEKNIKKKLTNYLKDLLNKYDKSYNDFEVLIYNIFLENINNKRNSCNNFEYYYNKEKESDFIFSCEEKNYKVHSYVLLFHSNFFKNLFKNNDISKKGNVLTPKYTNYNNFLLNNNKINDVFNNNEDNNKKKGILDLNNNDIENDIQKINNIKFDFKINKIKFPTNFKEIHIDIILNFLYKNNISVNFENFKLEDLFPILNIAILFELKELISEISYNLLIKLNKDNIFNILNIILKGFKNENVNKYQSIIILISLISLTFHLKIILESKQYDINIKKKIMNIFSYINIDYIIEFIEFYIIFHRRITDYENEFFINILMIGYNSTNISDILKKYTNNDNSILSFDIKSYNSYLLDFVTKNGTSFFIKNHENSIYKENDFNQFKIKPDDVKLNLLNIDLKNPFINLDLKFEESYNFLITEIINFFQGGLRIIFEKDDNEILNIYFILNENSNENLMIKNFLDNIYGTFNIYLEIYEKNKISPIKGTQFLITLQKNSNILIGKNKFIKLNKHKLYNLKIYIKEDFILNNLLSFLSNNIDNHIKYCFNSNATENDYISIINEGNESNEIINELLKNEHFKINNNNIDYFNLNPFYLFMILSNDNLITEENVILLFIIELLNSNNIKDYEIILSALRFHFIELRILLIACIKHKFLIKTEYLKNYLKEKLENNLFNKKEDIYYYNKQRKNNIKQFNNSDDNYQNIISFLEEYDENEIKNNYSELIEEVKHKKNIEIKNKNKILDEKNNKINKWLEENINLKNAIQKLNQHHYNYNYENFNIKTRSKNLNTKNKDLINKSKNINIFYKIFKYLFPNF